MMRITKSFEWDMGHRLPQHEGQCRNLHGHRYRLELTVDGEVPASGMVLDFGKLKAVVQAELVAKVDHAFMYDESDTVVSGLFLAQPELKHIGVPFPPTAENILKWAYGQLRGAVPCRIVRMALYETPTSWAEFEPEH